MGNSKEAEEIRKKMQDDASRILFDGRISFLENSDPVPLYDSIRRYFEAAPENCRKDCPELFSVMKEDPEQKEGFTDIYRCFFDSEIIRPGKNEVFVDGGAQDLFTSYRFAKITGNLFQAIHAFEPASANHQECKGNTELFDDRLFLHKLALYDRAGVLSFTENRENSHVDGAGTSQVVCERLDDLFAKAPESVWPSFIKLHLEGSEYAALKGAEKILYTKKPKLALCIEHAPEDILRIPQFLLSRNPDYRFWLRHYSSRLTETVLYAI